MRYTITTQHILNFNANPIRTPGTSNNCLLYAVSFANLAYNNDTTKPHVMRKELVSNIPTEYTGFIDDSELSNIIKNGQLNESFFPLIYNRYRRPLIVMTYYSENFKTKLDTPYVYNIYGKKYLSNLPIIVWYTPYHTSKGLPGDEGHFEGIDYKIILQNSTKFLEGLQLVIRYDELDCTNLTGKNTNSGSSKSSGSKINSVQPFTKSKTLGSTITQSNIQKEIVIPQAEISYASVVTKHIKQTATIPAKMTQMQREKRIAELITEKSNYDNKIEQITSKRMEIELKLQNETTNLQTFNTKNIENRDKLVKEWKQMIADRSKIIEQLNKLIQ
jgi:hypothetical protein